jgi:hypothetical protein
MFVFAVLLDWVVSVLFPRWTARQRRKRSHPTKRELLLRVAGAMLAAAIGRWLGQGALERTNLVGELRDQLGREPTGDEIMARLAEMHGYA